MLFPPETHLQQKWKEENIQVVAVRHSFEVSTILLQIYESSAYN